MTHIKKTTEQIVPNQKHFCMLFILSKPQTTVVHSQKLFLYFVRIKQTTEWKCA